MADSTIEVPAAQVRRLLVSAFREFAAVARSLETRADACVADENGLDRLRGDLTLLRDIEDVMDDLRWSFDQRDAPVRITGHPELLADITHGAVTAHIEGLREMCARYHEGSVDAEALRACVGSLDQLVELLVIAHDGAPSASPPAA
jgi:hypothetical protein